MTTSTQDRAAISTEKYVRNKVVVSETTVTVLLVHVGRGTAFVRVLVCYIFDRDWILKRGREKVPYVTLAEQASNGQAIGRAIFLWQYSLGHFAKGINWNPITSLAEVHIRTALRKCKLRDATVHHRFHRMSPLLIGTSR
uniref:Uncharacterized protein n=1 Tax=Vespula pensylvanica TaxID=30213 RepID=A0A834UH66_VESPE|nr:hypothetical protein H0235_001596 [Vespula pensylvanica]